ncbi:MAG TPA: di-heme oxidoredictase family protein [Kofleriaceae bacterium]|nr:di-heme oxidoredictase family protein [Kofleriaceae bacterium]
MNTLTRTAALAAALAACGGGGGAGDDESRQGGQATVDDRSLEAFSHFATGLTADEQAIFQAGRGPFNFHWLAPQLGPLFSNDSCFGCHVSFGRGESQIGNGAQFSQALVRVSLVDGTPEVPGGDVPVPGFGLQLQDHANVGVPEVVVDQSWVEHAETYGDGTTIMLRAPMVVPHTPDGQPLAQDVRQSYRQAPPLIGLGLLAAVSDDTLTALADPDDADGDGISGRPNLVWDRAAQATVIGRFGHKASEPNLRQQAAGAFATDMGLSNLMFPDAGNQRDVPDDQFDQVTFFVSALAVPAAAPRNAAAQTGRQRFDDFGCAGCHVPTLTTGESAASPAFAHQTIHPYTDLLLHDVGDLLSDARRDFLADGTEWRTPPLWGLGLTQQIDPLATFLHDGRARTLEEAILWHGGEAMTAREAFRNAGKPDRDALIGFLQTL